ncbi:DUF4232 domain-containing protein [Streptosporangium pseudovulgare]|uniref:Lipoprotein n=1 Tax=Streptosporangium pseudovulgare TaxID=35765 RepID=A0ABQ2R2C5_9ACTN|nr:DUF4232 domain-containing protein [Streptosporangium pseudovulgare]GGQ10143.1 lipoprotein [Streptosporangium pseudovulgare]
MRRSNGAGSLPAFSMMVAGVLMASVACGSVTPAQRSIPPAGNAAGDARPADAAPIATGSAVTAMTGDTAPATAGEARTAGAVPAAGAAALSGAAAPGRCRTGALSARVGRVDAGAGQRYAPLVLTNRSTRTCWVYGFPGLVTLDRNGDALRTRPRRENVRPQRVTLRPGASAHFRMHWTEVPSGRETTCPASARLMVIPPDETAYLTTPFSARVCGDGRIDLTPAAPGARL